MVDLHEDNRSNSRKRIDGKVKGMMDQTPSFLKSKILSVLGSSNDLINGLTTKLDMAVNLSSSSDTNSNEQYKNRNSITNKTDELSLDENIIDFESRKVKERRAHDEVTTGRYRHPNFVTTLAFEDCNMIDINPESSISPASNSDGTATEDDDKTDKGSLRNSPDEENGGTRNSATVADDSLAVHRIDSIASLSTNDNASRVSSASKDEKQCKRSGSTNSAHSWESNISLDSASDDDSLEFMKRYVTILFENSSTLTLELKSEFGEKSRTEAGRLWFARLVSSQRTRSKRVTENTFFSLIQHFAIILFECSESDDFTPAKILMNMCFTFYYEVEVPGCDPYREYLYTYLRDQPIWHALRFWNAVFFDAVQYERSHKAIPQTLLPLEPQPSTTDDDEINNDAQTSKANVAILRRNNLDFIRDDQLFLQNICFGQLGTFTCNMHAFGLSKDLCDEFLRKQCIISNLRPEQEKMLYDNINRLYKETAKWRKK